jgi:UPF0755 protein
MNGDIIPPRRPPVNVPPRQPQPPTTAPLDPVQGSIRPSQALPEINLAPSIPDQTAQIETQDVTSEPAIPPAPKPRSHLKRWLFVIAGVLVAVSLALLGWYLLSLRPVASGDVDKIRVTINKGDLPLDIAQSLEKKHIIRSASAFYLHARITGVSNKLQPGTFSLSPAESTQQITTHLLTGNTEEYSVTFYPGATLNTAADSPNSTPSHRQVLEKLGFKAAEIDEAFAADYSQLFPTLFTDKPAGTDLEGYIYGQTYRVASGASVKQILMRTFAEYELQIKQNDLVAGFQRKNLNLYQGITLSSIVQREVLAPSSTEPSNDQKQVAQVFFTRLGSGMMLGSDVTYHYAADKMGVPRDHTLESPYNTRIKTGLPPGPIASPGITALKAVAAPAQGDYVYFLSGDDDKTYFAHTNDEHEANIRDHCAVKCSLP